MNKAGKRQAEYDFTSDYKIVSVVCTPSSVLIGYYRCPKSGPIVVPSTTEVDSGVSSAKFLRTETTRYIRVCAIVVK